MKYKRRMAQNKRVTGLPVDARVIAEATLADGTKQTIWQAKDGAIYTQRFEKVTYRLLGGK